MPQPVVLPLEAPEQVFHPLLVDSVAGDAVLPELDLLARQALV